jgi:hypothetical protein
MSEYILNSNPEPLGNLGGMTPHSPHVPAESPQNQKVQSIQNQIPYNQVGGYIPASMRGSAPLTVGIPEALGAEKRLSYPGANPNRAYFQVNSNGQIVVPSQNHNSDTQNQRAYNVKMGIPSFGNASYFG